MLFSESRNRKVVSSSDAATVGKVARFVVDPVARQVVALELRKTDGGDLLRWGDITAFGTDAVTVPGHDAIGTATPDVAELAAKDRRILGKRLLTTAGDELGTVDDVAFDPGTGSLSSLVPDRGPEVSASRLLGVGSYAVVVRAEP
jgi:sporulation protein YlmC with PRC-barrel domain